MRKFVKAHIVCGVKTNIITAVNITPGQGADSPQLIPLFEQTKRIFEVREFSADMAYSSRANMKHISDNGAIPYIPFRKNAIGKPKGVWAWRRMFDYFMINREEFMNHYHKRSNVESAFHMVKQKFGTHLRSKTVEGQRNEILAKCLCHNLCALILEALELGVKISFEKCANVSIAQI